jgi:hypothetical protein
VWHEPDAEDLQD